MTFAGTAILSVMKYQKMIYNSSADNTLEEYGFPSQNSS